MARLRDAHGVLLRFAGGEETIAVELGARVVAEAAHRDPVERTVGVAVASAVEAVPVGLAGRGGDRRDTAEVSERGRAVDPVGVVADGGEQLPGDIGRDTEHRDQGGCGLGDELVEVIVEIGDVVTEMVDVVG